MSQAVRRGPRHRLGAWGIALLSLSLTMACSDDGGKAKAGGQSGLEGGCDASDDSVTPLDGDAVVDDALAFRPSQVIAMVEAQHTATLRFASYTGVHDAKLDVGLTVEPDRGEAHVGCVTALELPARLTLHSSDGALDIETAATIFAPQADLAYVDVELARDQLEPWNARLAELFTLAEDDSYPVRLKITPEDVSGTFALLHQAHGVQASASCELGSWPAQRVCPIFQREVAFGELVRGFDPRELVADFNAIGARELTWEDGSTSLTTELELAGEVFCLQDNLPDPNGEPTDGISVGLPARAHLTTIDGALDVRMNVTASTTLDASGRRDSVFVLGHTLLSGGSNVMPGVAAPDAGLIKLFASAERGSLDVSRLTPISPSTVSDDIDAACLNNPDFLGQWQRVAQGSW